MSYESKLDNQSSKLINPAQLSLLLSVVFHLLVLRFGLPTIRFDDDGGRREVSVIELNPEQQSRLPDRYAPPEVPDVAVPDLPQTDLSDLDEPVAPFAIPPNFLPEQVDPADLPPLIIPPPPNSNIPSLPPVTDITLPPVGDLSDLPLPPNIDPLDFKVEPIELPPNAGNLPEQPTDSTEVEQPQNPKPKNPQSAANPKLPVQPPNSKPNEEPEQKPTEVKPETPEQIAARKVAQSSERIKNLRQSLSRTNEGTSNEEARKNYIVWLAKVRDVEPEQIEITGTYPRDACIRRLKGSSVFGVVVNAKGEVVALDLLKGSKFPIFNAQGSKNISDRTFENETEKPKPYQVKVNYEYDAEICPSLTLPSIRRAEEKQQAPTPEPKPAPAPEPKPAPVPEPKPAPEPTPAPQPDPAPAPEPKPAPKPAPAPQPEPEPAPVPTPEPEPTPSLRDRLRDVPLKDLDPSKLKDVPLPERPNFNR